MVLDERYVEEPQMRTPPVFDLKPEPVETGEGEPAKFLVKVGGYPRPRVSWWINGSLVVSVSSTSFSGILQAHLDPCESLLVWLFSAWTRKHMYNVCCNSSSCVLSKGIVNGVDLDVGFRLLKKEGLLIYHLLKTYEITWRDRVTMNAFIANIHPEI